MKRKLLFTLIALIVAMVSVQAREYIDGLYYNLDATTQTAEVTYKNANVLSNSSYVRGELTIPETVTYNGITYSVTNIGDEAFHDCSSLTSVTIPNSVTSIGDHAFCGCSSLTSVTIGNSVTSIGDCVFLGCISLTSVTIPNSVASIGTQAFSYCISLTSITIPNSVTSIGVYAFLGCSSLTSITIPNSVTSIGGGAFNECSLTTIIVEKGNIVYDSRNNCNAIIETATNTLIRGCMNTIIPESVTSIGDEAFWRCSNLTNITIPNSVTNIGDYAFFFCGSLTSVTIPNSVTSIGKWVFYGCGSLTTIIVESGNTTYDSRNNCNAIIETATNTLIQGCMNTIIPESVTSIGSGAFSWCENLTNITIPNSVTSIGDYAFNGCQKLSSIYNYASVPQDIEQNTFENVNKNTCVLYVPKESVQAYRTALVWQEFKQIVGVEVPEDTAIDDVFLQTNTATTQKVLIDGNIYLITPDGKKLNMQGAEVK